MYFLISFLSSFTLSFLFFRNVRKKTNEKFLEQTKLFLEKNEKLIEYNLIRKDGELTVAIIVGFFSYLIISVFINQTFIRTLLSEIFPFDYIDLFFFTISLIFIIQRNNIIFSEILVLTNKAIIHICKNEIKDKIEYLDIKEIKYRPFSMFGIKTLIIKLKNNKNKIFSDFSNSKNTYLTIYDILNSE